MHLNCLLLNCVKAKPNLVWESAQTLKSYLPLSVIYFPSPLLFILSPRPLDADLTFLEVISSITCTCFYRHNRLWITAKYTWLGFCIYLGPDIYLFNSMVLVLLWFLHPLPHLHLNQLRDPGPLLEQECGTISVTRTSCNNSGAQLLYILCALQLEAPSYLFRANLLSQPYLWSALLCFNDPRLVPFAISTHLIILEMRLLVRQSILLYTLSLT